MAPFARGRGSPRATHKFQSSGGGRGRGTGRGRGKAKAHSSNRSTFLSSRVEEPLNNDSGESSESPKPEDTEDRLIYGDPSSDSEDDIGANTTAKPYSMLLESLIANNHRGQPQRKKRKAEHKEELIKEDDQDQDLDLIEEPEEVEYHQLGDAENADELDDADDSKSPKACGLDHSQVTR